MSYRLGLIGFPVNHSLSPSFQQPALDALGIDARYELWPTPLEAIPERVASLRDLSTLGANVTVPHKQAVVPYLDELSDVARQAEAVNTIVNRDGKLLGDNTDVYGIERSLREAGIREAGFRAVVLGAGGAARAVVLALGSLGAGEIIIANRSPERAAGIQEAFPELGVRVVDTASAELSEALAKAGLLVNSTSLGWNANETPLDLTLLASMPSNGLVFDLTYRDTLLLTSAAGRGLNTLDGLPMLVYQGARAFELWTGRPAPVELMMQAGLEARATRS